MWANYRVLGHTRLIYVNTAAVIVSHDLIAALGEEVTPTGVLLTGSDESTRRRLAGREIGSALDRHVSRSSEMAARLEREAPEWVVRVPTDGRSITEIATEVVDLTGWSADR